MIADLVDLVLSGEDDDALWDLAEEIRDDPAALRPYLTRLLDAEAYVPETLFRAADEEFQREAVARVEAGHQDAPWLVTVLTATRGPVVEDAFRRWLRQPPSGLDADRLAAHLRSQGWDFDAEGRARQSCSEAAYRLVPQQDGAPAAPCVPSGHGGGSVASGQGGAVSERSAGSGHGGAPSEPSDERCPWCAGPRWTVLDVDTADPRVAAALVHAGWRGRLRITTCFLCSEYGTTYAEVTGDGGSAWSAHTVRPALLTERVPAPAEPPSARLVPGEQRSPLYLGDDHRGRSTLGGRPGWVQDPDYPACPACGGVMAYVGAVAKVDVDDGAVGAAFLFLHTPCGLAGVVSQFD
jgi:hypothetical protein